MKIEIVEKDDSHIKFVLDESNPAFANALRRIMIAEVPTLAIEKVTFFENSSALYDEVIAHRLGLVPIKTDSKDYNFPNDCNCKEKGCSKCQVSFSLNKKGPGTVCTEDLKSDSKDAVPADGKIPIVRLHDNQKLKFEATAVLGKGKEHAKFQPGTISYQYFDEEKGKGDKFLFYVESNGSMKPEQIVSEAAKILEAKAKDFSKLVK